jgi:signal transduction histidine kinase
LTIRVRDRGPGIPESDINKVFEPFYRLEGSRSRDTGGTGLGLSIARNIAQSHGGEVRLRNHEGGGLDAILTLPRKPEPGMPAAMAAAGP